MKGSSSSHVALLVALLACSTAISSAPVHAQSTLQAPDLEILLEAQEVDADFERPSFDDAGRADDRAQMVRAQIEFRGVINRDVRAAMRRVPRHLLVPPELRDRAYDDTPLPIGHGQTISQPYIVALMTDLLEVDGEDTVLEVGTGSGYQAAVLAEIVRRVVTIEIIEPLARRSARDLEALGYPNITVLHGDGYFGRPDTAPYDAIIVTAAASHVPPPLLAQLKPGGRMAIPVGRNVFTQNLLLVAKDTAGNVITRNIAPVAFVPLTGGH